MGPKERGKIMNDVKHINEVIERAKHQRAEYIGTALQAYALPAVLVAGISLMLLQLSGNPPAAHSEAVAHAAQVTAADR